MDDALTEFISIVRKRSNDHATAFKLLDNLPSIQAALVRMELDSLLRVVYVCHLPVPKRGPFAQLFLTTGKFKSLETGKRIADREMVQIAGGWVERAYEFGCAFVHLTYLHDMNPKNDVSRIFSSQGNDVEEYLKEYHDRPVSGELSLRSLLPYFQPVFDKIHRNIEHYAVDLEDGELPEYIV